MLPPSIYRSATIKPERQPVSEGIASGCIFCIARIELMPRPGTKIVMLCDSYIGQTGTVRTERDGIRHDEFLVRMDYDREYTMRVSWLHGLYAPTYKASIPDWQPNLSMQDTLAVHEAILRGLDNADDELATDLQIRIADHLVSSCWHHRIPIEQGEVSGMLLAHGLSDQHLGKILELFEYGRRSLERNSGRPAIKRKRMQAMSKGRYLTKHKRELWLNHFGYAD